MWAAAHVGRFLTTYEWKGEPKLASTASLLHLVANAPQLTELQLACTFDPARHEAHAWATVFALALERLASRRLEKLILTVTCNLGVQEQAAFHTRLQERVGAALTALTCLRSLTLQLPGVGFTAFQRSLSLPGLTSLTLRDPRPTNASNELEDFTASMPGLTSLTVELSRPMYSTVSCSLGRNP